MGDSAHLWDLRIHRVAFLIDSLFPIILLGLRLNYGRNVGTHLEAERPRHIKADVRSHVYEKLHAWWSTSWGDIPHGRRQDGSQLRAEVNHVLSKVIKNEETKAVGWARPCFLNRRWIWRGVGVGRLERSRSCCISGQNNTVCHWKSWEVLQSELNYQLQAQLHL